MMVANYMILVKLKAKGWPQLAISDSMLDAVVYVPARRYLKKPATSVNGLTSTCWLLNSPCLSLSKQNQGHSHKHKHNSMERVSVLDRRTNRNTPAGFDTAAYRSYDRVVDESDLEAWRYESCDDDEWKQCCP